MTEMSPAEAIFFAAAALPTSERASYLAQVCAGRDDLRRRVEQMLAAQPVVGNFLEPPARAGDGTSAHVPDGQPPTEDHGDPTARIGSILAGKYKLIEAIGEGGMGSVYMAQQTEPVKRAVAVKVIKAGMDSKAVLARFEAERQALAMMDHPNIARVLDAGTTEGGRPFFVMELVKGTPITQFCDERKLTPQKRLELFVPVCLAIQHAHQKGIIHRDVKPSNVLIAMYDDHPVPKVIDFGVAKAAGQSLTDLTLMTGFGAVVGTPEYMSPEQANLNNLDVDTRSDVYSLGVLLYELLTGSTPVDRKSLGKAALLEILRIVREVEAPRPSARLSTIDTLPSVAANRGTEPAKLSKLTKGELDWVVLRALEKDRTRRYDTANGLARDVQRYLADEVVEARPPSAGYRLKKFVRRHKGQVIAASLVLLALLAGVVGTTWGLIRAEKAKADLIAKNAELAAEQAKVQARFDTAVKAIETFHTGVSEDMLLKNPEFKELRTKLLKEAARFYEELETLLAGQTDAKSRKTLAAGYFQLAELTDKIGDKAQALAVHRKALAVRRELAAESGADVETRLDVARSLGSVGRHLLAVGDVAGARQLFEEQRDLAEQMEAHDPTEDGKVLLAHAHDMLSGVFAGEGKMSEALESRAKGLAIYRKLADAKPADGRFRQWQAGTHVTTGGWLTSMGKATEALESLQKALVIMQPLADGDKGNADYQEYLAGVYNGIGDALMESGRPAEAVEAFRKAAAVWRKQADTHRAVTHHQANLVFGLNNIGVTLHRAGSPVEALEQLREALPIQQKLADANPAVIDYHQTLAWIQNRIGEALLMTGKPAEALRAYRSGLALYQKVSPSGWGEGWSQNLIGEATLVTGSPAEALEWFRKAVAVLQKTVKDHPGNVDFESFLTTARNNVGRAEARQKRFAEAFVAFDTGLALYQKLAEAEPKNTVYKTELGRCHAYRGAARACAGQPAEAAADLRRALGLWATGPNLSVEAQLERARTLAILAGLGGESKSGVTKDEAKAFADQSVAALAEVVKAGWALPSELKEPDFDAVRGRADFRKLVAEVGAKAEKPAPAPPEKK